MRLRGGEAGRPGDLEIRRLGDLETRRQGRLGDWEQVHFRGEVDASLKSQGTISGVCRPYPQTCGFMEVAGPGEKCGLPHKTSVLAARGPRAPVHGPSSSWQPFWGGHSRARLWCQARDEPQLSTLGDSEPQSLYPVSGTKRTLMSQGTWRGPGEMPPGRWPSAPAGPQPQAGSLGGLGWREGPFQPGLNLSSPWPWVACPFSNLTAFSSARTSSAGPGDWGDHTEAPLAGLRACPKPLPHPTAGWLGTGFVAPHLEDASRPHARPDGVSLSQGEEGVSVPRPRKIDTAVWRE